MKGAVELILDGASNGTVTVSRAEEIGSGKQGVVYAPTFDESIAIKLYHRPGPETGQRLQAMKLIARPGDFAIHTEGTAGGGHLQLAWPTDLVYDPRSFEIIGYAMPRFERDEYVPLDRLWDHSVRHASCPGRTWLFLLTVAANVATLTAMVHERGLVLGDVRDANFLFSPRSGLVAFVDCDSMPVTHPVTQQYFPCALSHDDHAPPELHINGDIRRSWATDSFSIAILVCRLLLVGDHPFAGYPVTSDDGEDDGGELWQNIAAGRSYVVTPDQVATADGTVSADVLPPAVRDLAVSAFSTGLREPGARPAASAWRSALRAALGAVEDCTRRPEMHAYSSHLWTCPWCQLAGHGMDPFTPPATVSPKRRRGPAVALVLLLVIVVVLAAVATAVVGIGHTAGNRVHTGPPPAGAPASAIPATVIGRDANARVQPSISAASVSVLPIGEQVTISCNIEGEGARIGWDRLVKPYEGTYVAADLVEPERAPPDCEVP